MWSKTSSQTPSQGLKFQWRKGPGIQLGKGPHPGKVGEGTGAFRDLQNIWRCQEPPPSPLNMPEDAGSPQRHSAHLEV